MKTLICKGANTDISQTNSKGQRCRPMANCEIGMAIISEVAWVELLILLEVTLLKE